MKLLKPIVAGILLEMHPSSPQVGTVSGCGKQFTKVAEAGRHFIDVPSKLKFTIILNGDRQVKLGLKEQSTSYKLSGKPEIEVSWLKEHSNTLILAGSGGRLEIGFCLQIKPRIPTGKEGNSLIILLSHSK